MHRGPLTGGFEAGASAARLLAKRRSDSGRVRGGAGGQGSAAGEGSEGRREGSKAHEGGLRKRG